MKEILGNGLDTIVSQALQKMKEEQGESIRYNKLRKIK